MTVSGYLWKPIEAPPDPPALAVEELRPLRRLWAKQHKRLMDINASDRFQQSMDRWWSIETGVIERLYDLSPGTTLMLVEHGFEASLVAHGEATIPAEELILILRAHRDALGMVMDMIGGTRPFTVGWIKELHALITRTQATTRAMTPQGQFVDAPLCRGQYKTTPNNPLRDDDGLLHEYCPPEQVASEMDRLVQIYETLPVAFPEVRAAWLHHAFAQIHPFQDGNGRVARALASIDFIRAGLFPLIVTRTDKKHYLDVLRRADQGELKPLVQFFATCMDRVMLKAISAAESAVGEAESLATVLAAAQKKMGDRTAVDSQARTSMAKRLDRFSSVAYEHFMLVRDPLRKAIPELDVIASHSVAGTQHYFFGQIIEIARRQGYWADMREARSWARVQIRNGGTTDIVVVLHFVGNPSPDTCVAAVFLDHRENQESVGSNPSILVPVEPLLLTAEEAEAAQEQRFIEWLEGATVQALAQWTKYL
jgi:fido (protein-threonine AMPylation protein)